MKSQSAMEYLMTYGWAILIIAIVLVAFFSLGLFNPYTFKPKASPGNCQIIRPNGPGTSSFVSLVGTCLNEIPQSAASFNGISSQIKMPSTAIVTGSKITMVVWANIAGPGDFSQEDILTQHDTQLRTTSGTPAFVVEKSASNHITTTGTDVIPDGVWVQYIGVFNGLTASLYINSIPSGTPVSWTNISTVYNATIYVGNYDISPRHFNGSIANVQIYNISLSSNEIIALYEEGIGGKPIDIQHIVDWWPLNGNAYDYSGNNNNGTVTNVTFTSDWETGYTAPS